MRLDTYLFENKLTASRTRASNLVQLRQVKVNGVLAQKSSMEVSDADCIEILDDYSASLGTIKLEGAFSAFNVSARGRVCVDIGASNGGFTDILLSKNASLVYAVDVGECALPDRLRNDSRVVVMDRTNARFLKKSDFALSPSLAVIDVSFISLELVLPAVEDILVENGEIIALIKPQFECTKRDLTKAGLVKNAKIEQQVLAKIKDFCKSLSLEASEIIPAPHPFKNKNQEYFIQCRKQV